MEHKPVHTTERDGRGKGYSEQALNGALMILQRRDILMFRNQGAQVYRNGA
ncbi:DNA replication licensing factor mcm5 [Fusarium oxysporum f. sp. phaseoli]